MDDFLQTCVLVLFFFEGIGNTTLGFLKGFNDASYQRNEATVDKRTFSCGLITR